MITTNEIPNLMDGGTVVGSDGDTIGKIGVFYVDNTTGEPNWVTVKTGWFGTKESFVPLDQASTSERDVHVPFDKATIKDAPNYEAGEPLSEEDEAKLYSYYNLTPAAGYTTENEYVAPAVETVAPAQESVSPAQDAVPAGTDGEYLTRSEEQLHVGTEKVQAGKARLRKYVVTEQQTVTVPVSHEEVQVVREPIEPGDSLDGATIGEATLEANLTADQVVVNKDVVGVEKVRLDTTAVTEQQNVTEGVRKEQVELDGASEQASLDRP